jgi:hypothetical protein
MSATREVRSRVVITAAIAPAAAPAAAATAPAVAAAPRTRALDVTVVAAPPAVRVVTPDQIGYMDCYQLSSTVINRL